MSEWHIIQCQVYGRRVRKNRKKSLLLDVQLLISHKLHAINPYRRLCFSTYLSTEPTWSRTPSVLTLLHGNEPPTCVAYRLHLHLHLQTKTCHIQGCPKTGTFLYALTSCAFTSSNINRFSNLFHCLNQENIL